LLLVAVVLLTHAMTHAVIVTMMCDSCSMLVSTVLHHWQG
jgi:hypothetical protein